MKIVHLCLSNFYVEGFGYQENLLTKYHKKAGHDVTIIASRFSYRKDNAAAILVDTGEYINSDGCKVIRIDYKYKFLGNKINGKLRIYKDTYKLLEKEKPDLIFTHGIQLMDVHAIIKYKKDYPDVKIYADNHADYINSARNVVSKYILHKIIWKSCAKKLAPQCEKIFGVTPNRCDFLVEMYGIPKEKIELLVMGADSEKIDFDNKDQIRKKIRKDLCLEEDDFVLITGGKIDKRKNIQYLMKAVNEIANNKLKLIVFGTPSDEMRDTIEDLSKSKFIKNIGWVSSDNIYNYFLASNLAVFPGTHSVLWEQAVGTGIPCIFKKWQGMTHVDVGGNCEFIYEGNVEEIKNSITNIYNDKSKYNNMEKIACNKGIPYFSYYKIARQAIDE